MHSQTKHFLGCKHLPPRRVYSSITIKSYTLATNQWMPQLPERFHILSLII